MTITSTHPQVRRGVTRSISTLAEGLLLIVGLPSLLIVAVGWPLPHSVPQWSEVHTAYQLRYMPDRFVIGALACAGWVCWALIMWSLAVALVARHRATEHRRPALMPKALHRLSTRWVGAAALVAAMATRPASAAVAPIKTVAIQSTRSVDLRLGPQVERALPVANPRVKAVATGRSYTTADHQTYWQVAEATLGDGTRWREILEANPSVGKVDLIAPGTQLNIPSDDESNEVTIRKGDNLWKLSANELADAHGTKPTNREIVPYWKTVIDANEDTLRSGDPDLIFPGEEVTLPAIEDDKRTKEADTSTTAEVSGGAAVPTLTELTIPAVPSTVPVTTEVAPTSMLEAASASPVQDDDLDDYEPFNKPLLVGLAISGASAAAILAAWHAQRKRRMRMHKHGDPMPTLTDPDRDLITQLRGIAEPERREATDQAMRLLAADSDEGLIGVTVGRAGQHNVELLLDNATDRTPKRFVRLDNHTIVPNPGLTESEIAAAIEEVANPTAALIDIGTDDIGTVYVDLEKMGALSIEHHNTEPDAVLLAMLTSLACLPSTTKIAVHTIGTDPVLDPERRITRHETTDNLLDAIEAHLAAVPDEAVLQGTHQARIGGTVVPTAVVVLGPGHREEAETLTDASKQPGAALAVITSDPIANTSWRLIVVGDQATLEPAGLTVRPRTVTVDRIEPDANEQLCEMFGEPTPPEDDLPPEINLWNEPTDSAVEVPFADLDDSDRIDELSLAIGDFDQLVLVREPSGVPLADGLTVSEQIDRIMERKPVELVLLDGPPRLEGVDWDPKKAPRADEIVAFLALNGPSTLRQLALALWPDHPRPDATATQQVSRARLLLGVAADGRQRINKGNRATPYLLHDVGCDWHRFEQLADLADKANPDDRTSYVRAAMSLARKPPFEGCRQKSFDWASDHCFDSRIRLRLSKLAEFVSKD
jgi:nucleoid-associated protein YgaU